MQNLYTTPQHSSIIIATLSQGWQNYSMLRALLTLLTLLTTAPYAHALDQDSSKAVILAYHRVGAPEHPNTNIRADLFDQHIEEITKGSYTVLPLPDIIEALKNQTSLPPKTIAITFEGGHRSAYDNAIQKLIKRDIPFTIFVASETTKIPNHLDWKTLKKIAKFKGANIGILPAYYEHITHKPENEITRLINKSRIALKEHTGIEAQFFSYPYGEISNTLLNVNKAQGFTAAFGLHSGPAHSKSNMLTLPRFAMTTQYANIDRFRMITSTTPLPVTDQEPNNWKITTSIDQIGFTVSPEFEKNLDALSCHISGQSKPTMEILGNRVEIIPDDPITDERTRLNCTLPYNKDNQTQHRWLGMLFHTSHQN